MLPALKTFLAAAAKVQSETSKTVRIHLIGTSGQPAGGDQHNLSSLIENAGLDGKVCLHPARVGYLDALRTMQDADLLLLLGSTDSHYTASKLFPYWLSGRQFPLFVGLARELGGTTLVTYDEQNGPGSRIAETALLLGDTMKGKGRPPSRNEEAFAPYSVDGIAARYARLFDRVARVCD